MQPGQIGTVFRKAASDLIRITGGVSVPRDQDGDLQLADPLQRGFLRR